uniref:Calcium voltage-gated channel subunit alpha1 I n=1 Tax=Salmo trutta TaxID=8032 RepID=A0A674C9Q5_SALTR
EQGWSESLQEGISPVGLQEQGWSESLQEGSSPVGLQEQGWSESLQEEEECNGDNNDDDDAGSDISTLIVPYPELAPVIFFCLKQTTFPRSCIILNPGASTWFERCSIMVILLNCVTLGMYQPCENIDCSSDRCKVLQAFDVFIYVFFAVEMVVKMMALGIFGRRCYLGDTWNRLDFFIVMAGMVEYSLDLQNINLSAIRTVRVLRPLKAINRVPSKSPIDTTITQYLPDRVPDLLTLWQDRFFFIFAIFYITVSLLLSIPLSSSLFLSPPLHPSLLLSSKDISLPRPYYMADEDDERPFICSLAQDNGIMACTDVPARRELGRTCCLDKDDVTHRQGLGLSPEPLVNGSVSGPGLCINWNQYYTRCHTGHSNPHKGAINFDNIAYAWIVIFQVITLEGWVEIMYYVMDAHSFYNFIYFILLIIIGSFFMINLCLVVIATQFSETKQREHQLMQEQRAQAHSSSTLASMTEPSAGCYESVFQLVCHVLRKARRYGVWRPIHAKIHLNISISRIVGRQIENAVHCPHHTKPDHASPGDSITLTVSPATDGCPHCTVALSISDGAGPADSLANLEVEEGALEETDGEGSKCGAGKEEVKDGAPAKVSGGCRRGCGELWEETRLKLLGIVESKYFNRGIMIAILINTISMGIEHHNQPEELTNVLEICNIVFTSMFAMEMILKITASGCFNYLRNPYNVFDGVIVIISVCEIIGQSDGGLSILRTFRLLRVLKLVRFMPALRRQLVVLMKTMDNVATFCMLLMLFIFIFSILGMHIFGCKFSLKTEAGDTVPDRKNFDSLLWAIVTVFQILTQEDWNTVLYNGMAATSPLAALYFVALMTFGNYVLFNLLVAILVEGFQAEGGWERVWWEEASVSEAPTPFTTRPSKSSSSPPLSTSPLTTLPLSPSSPDAMPSGTGTAALSPWSSQICSRSPGDLRLSMCFRIQKMMEVYRPDWCEKREDWSVYLFSPQNKFRLLCQSIIAHKLFDYVVLSFIFLNCITVALERPKILQSSLERLFLTVSNYVFTAIFVAEMTVKVVSKGLYLGEKAYLKSSWNVLDGFLVFVSLIDIVVSMAGGAKILGVLRVLRLLRTLRPLRVISRAPGLKLVVETLITSLKPIGNIVLICCAFFIIFGILGVQLFKGKFYYCLGLEVKNITNKSDCLQANYRWVHHKYNFDNLGQALMSLFVLASKDGWVNIMYHGLDAVGIDQQPSINNNPWMLLYFISFLLIVSFFVLNMFVGVVVENFHKCRQNQEVEEAKRREEKRQRRMEKKRRKAQKLPYYTNYSHGRLMIHTLCTSHYLDLFITFIICINVITMSLEHYSQPQSLETSLKYCNYFFTTTFVVESVLKLIGFGFRRFFKDRWNQLDLSIVLLSVMGIVLEEIDYNASLPINPTIIRIMRVLRIARVLKLLKMATGMRALLDTVVQALPQVGNLGLLFMLLFFIYAALGVELFGELVCNADYPCEGMSRHATFENFGMAFLTLFQVSTGDNWNGIMKDTLRECPPGPSDYPCHAGLQFISPMYFVSFVLTAQFVLINVVVAVLMKHLDDSNKEAQEDAEMDAEIELELAQGQLQLPTCCMGGLEHKHCLLFISIHCGPLLSIVVLFYPLWSSSIHCGPLLSIVYPFYPLWSPSSHCGPLLSIVVLFYPLWSSSIHCGPLLSIVVPFFPLRSPSIHCGPLLSIVVPFYPLWSPSIHCGPLLSIVVPFYPLWSSSIHCGPLLSIVVPFYPLWSPSIHCGPLLSIVVLSYPLWSSPIHCGPLLSIVAPFYPLWSPSIHCGFLLSIVGSFYPLWVPSIHCGPLLSIVVLSYPLWSSSIHCGPLLSIVGSFYPLWSPSIHCGPLLPIVVLFFPLWSSSIHCGPLLSIVVLSYPLWTSSIYCGPLLSIVVPFYPLWSPSIHCGPLLSIVVPFFPLWSASIHCGPLLSIVVRFYPLWSSSIHCGPLLSIVVPFYPLWSSSIHCGPLLSIVVPFYPLWSPSIHCGPLLSIVVLSYPLWSSPIHFGPLLSIVVPFYPLWSSSIHCGFLLSIVGSFYPLWSSSIHCGPLLSIVVLFYPLWSPSIHCGFLLSILVLFYPLWSPSSHCGPLLPIVVLFYPLWSSSIYCGPLLSIVVPFYPLWSPSFHCGPLLSIVVRFYPLWSSSFHCGPLLSIVVPFYPLWSSSIHCGPLLSIVVLFYPLWFLFYPLWSSSFHCGPLLSIVVRFYPLWSASIHCGPLLSIVVPFYPLWSSSIHCGPLLSIVVLFYPLWSSSIHCGPLLSIVVLSYPLWSSSIHCGPLLSIVALFYPLWPSSIHCGPLLSIVVLFYPLWTSSIHCGPLLSIVVFFYPLWTSSFHCGLQVEVEGWKEGPGRVRG